MCRRAGAVRSGISVPLIQPERDVPDSSDSSTPLDKLHILRLIVLCLYIVCWLRNFVYTLLLVLNWQISRNTFYLAFRHLFTMGGNYDHECITRLDASLFYYIMCLKIYVPLIVLCWWRPDNYAKSWIRYSDYQPWTLKQKQFPKRINLINNFRVEQVIQ